MIMTGCLRLVFIKSWGALYNNLISDHENVKKKNPTLELPWKPLNRWIPIPAPNQYIIKNLL